MKVINNVTILVGGEVTITYTDGSEDSMKTSASLENAGFDINFLISSAAFDLILQLQKRIDALESNSAIAERQRIARLPIPHGTSEAGFKAVLQFQRELGGAE